MSQEPKDLGKYERLAPNRGVNCEDRIQCIRIELAHNSEHIFVKYTSNYICYTFVSSIVGLYLLYWRLLFFKENIIMRIFQCRWCILGVCVYVYVCHNLSALSADFVHNTIHKKEINLHHSFISVCRFILGWLLNITRLS